MLDISYQEPQTAEEHIDEAQRRLRDGAPSPAPAQFHGADHSTLRIQSSAVSITRLPAAGPSGTDLRRDAVWQSLQRGPERDWACQIVACADRRERITNVLRECSTLLSRAVQS